jgi:hypothetical protein
MRGRGRKVSRRLSARAGVRREASQERVGRGCRPGGGEGAWLLGHTSRAAKGLSEAAPGLMMGARSAHLMENAAAAPVRSRERRCWKRERLGCELRNASTRMCPPHIDLELGSGFDEPTSQLAGGLGEGRGHRW